MFSFWLDEEAIKKAELFDGKPALVTNVQDFSADEVVQRYKALPILKEDSGSSNPISKSHRSTTGCRSESRLMP